MDNGISYDYINLYSASRSPSTVHVKNTRLSRYFRKYLLQKAFSVFKWTLPWEWDRDYFLYTLYCRGFIAILNTARYGTICQECSPGGYNLYYRPSYVIVTNPLIRDTLTLYIDRDCVLLKLQPDYSSIMDIVSYYADQLALASEAMGVNLVNTKSGVVFGADGKAQAETFKKMFDNLSEGDPAVVIGKKLLNDDGSPNWFPFVQNVKESYVTSDILSDMRKIEAMFDTEIGIPNANTDKRERLISDEVNANNVETATRCELWLETLRTGLDKANDMFGLQLAVDWRVNPKTEIADGWEGSGNNEQRR